jgi:glucoamylase
MYQRVQAAIPQVDLVGLAATILAFMRANVCSSAVVIEHKDQVPPYPLRTSQPGRVIASPSFTDVTNQDYVHHWVRDAAIVAMELAASPHTDADGADRTLCDYVAFSKRCQDNVAANPNVDFFRACFNIDGTPRDWSDQKDGPALQSLAFIQAWPYLDATAKATATQVAQNNLDEIVAQWDQDVDKFGLWEDVKGKSFFARAAQVRFLQEVHKGTDLGLKEPDGFDTALNGLRTALDDHWVPDKKLYCSVLDRRIGDSSQTDDSQYDPNFDVVMACIYGSIACTDPKLLSTAAQIRRSYLKGGSAAYPINDDDETRGFGPLIGRYPSDRYDGNTADGINDGRHPWAVCTLNLVQLYCRLANAFEQSQGPVFNDLTKPLFDDLGLDEATVKGGGQPVVDALRTTGDEMLQAVIYHSDHFHLSEQFDAVTGYDKSVQDLMWSYAAYLSAAREWPKPPPSGPAGP